ncbi:MAG TPA: hypothetical protein PLP57_07405 [Candidatus Saccharicenans sp.]|jgi:hypothetical protein|nr:hypothetical protein [Candidatus Saccharicenans sp.]HRD02452.1 hypothetical protein [Candidatus Saccharicenans sp.]
MLLFDIKYYSHEIDNTVDLFFKKMISPGDQLIIMTPARKMLSYSSKTIAESPQKVNREIKDTLKKHTSVTSSDYTTIYNQMLTIVNDISYGTGLEDAKNLIAAYENNRRELRNTRRINQDLLLQLSDIFKRSREITGDTDNRIYLFFQREIRPIPDKETMNRMREATELAFDATRVFLEEKLEPDFNTDVITEEFKNAGVTFNFVYINLKESLTQRYQLVDNSGDFYSAMSVIAQKTGGKTVTTNQPGTIFEDK